MVFIRLVILCGNSSITRSVLLRHSSGYVSAMLIPEAFCVTLVSFSLTYKDVVDHNVTSLARDYHNSAFFVNEPSKWEVRVNIFLRLHRKPKGSLTI